jgi:hypothetical protein
MDFLYKWWLTRFFMPIRLGYLFEAAAPVVADAIAPTAIAADTVGTTLAEDAAANASAMAAEQASTAAFNTGITGAEAATAAGGVGAGAGINAASTQAAATAIPNSGISALAPEQFGALSGANTIAPAASTAGITAAPAATAAPVSITPGDVFTPTINPVNAADATAASYGSNPSALNAVNGMDLSSDQAAAARTAADSSSFMNNPLMQGAKAGFDMVSNFASQHPIYTAVGAYMLGNKLGANKPNTTGVTPWSSDRLNNITLSPNFQGTHPNPQGYTAQQTMFPIKSAAMGGIMQAAPTPMGNNNYPMSHNAYTPYNNGMPQMPTPSDVTGMNGVQQYSTGDDVKLLNYYESMLSPQSSSASYTPPFKETNQFPTSTRNMTPQQAALYNIQQNSKAAGMQGPQLNVPSSGIGQVNLTPLMVAKQKQQDAASQQAIQAAQGGDESDTQSNAAGGIMGYDAVGQAGQFDLHGSINLGGQGGPQGANGYTPAGNQQYGMQGGMPPPWMQQQMQSAVPQVASAVMGSAHGGIMQAHGHLGNYAHGGNPRLLKGPGDGMSDNIPATIDGKQPARLATGEFVVPADVVSHMGNGDTDSGAKKLHDWMARVRQARTGNPKQGKEIDADKYLPK